MASKINSSTDPPGSRSKDNHIVLYVRTCVFGSSDYKPNISSSFTICTFMDIYHLGSPPLLSFIISDPKTKYNPTRILKGQQRQFINNNFILLLLTFFVVVLLYGRSTMYFFLLHPIDNLPLKSSTYRQDNVERVCAYNNNIYLCI